MGEQRDEWGEAVTERHDRILARDLAWVSYEAGMTRDGVAPGGGEHVAFNAGYAAGRANELDRISKSEPTSLESDLG